MGQDEALRKKITELEQSIQERDLELAKYRSELGRANHELERIIADLGHELKLAGQIQRVLSPTQLPNIQGVEFSTKFIPGMENGGDYFDIFEHEDRLKFGIVIASSSGYAMSALFLSVLIKLSGQIEARKGMEPHIVVSSIAKELLGSIENKDSASLFYGFVDRRTFELKFCSVGSVMGFHHVYGSDRLVKLIPSTGPLNQAYDETPLSQTLQLNPKDRLILCTEGFTATHGRSGKKFGTENLEKCVLRAARSGVHEVRNDILFQWEQFWGGAAGGVEPVRDLTVVVAEVNDRVIKLAK